ncbi:MAG: hypothetical protein NVSMB45_14620 [Ginsengibacter sp.]
MLNFIMNNSAEDKTTMTSTTLSVKITKLQGFDDPYFTEEDWMKLLLLNQEHSVYLTWKLQRFWWETEGFGELLLLLAEREGIPIALAPLFTDDGMIYNLTHKDRLDFIGNIDDPEILDAILLDARNSVNDFSGFVFYFIPDSSTTGQRLHEAAARLGLGCYKKGEILCPVLEIANDPQVALSVTKKKSLIRHENYFKREGDLEVLHFNTAEDILPYLDDFFEQHITRRNLTEGKSRFLDPGYRSQFKQLTIELGSTGWLRFTCLKWNGKFLAFHWGLSYRGRYLYAIPSFNIEFINHSPGEVMLRQLIIAAISEGATTFDLGIGNQEYKQRFCTSIPNLITWALYPLEDK